MSSKRERMRQMSLQRAALSQEENLVEEIAENLENELLPNPPAAEKPEEKPAEPEKNAVSESKSVMEKNAPEDSMSKKPRTPRKTNGSSHAEDAANVTVRETKKMESSRKRNAETSSEDRSDSLRQTSFKLLPENIRYLRYRSKVERIQILSLLSEIIRRDEEKYPMKGGIPDFSEPIGEKLRQPQGKAEYFSVRIYEGQFSYMSRRALLQNITVSAYLDALVTADREEYIKENT